MFCLKRALLAVHRRMIAEKWKAKLLLSVHDELVFEVPPAELKAVERNRRSFKLDTVRGAGHFPHEEFPDDVARLIRPRKPVIAAVAREVR